MFDVRSCKRLIVFGGSFDPPHRGHVSLPPLVRDRLGADAVLYVPAGQPPHKSGRVLAPAEDRLRMLRLALAGADRVPISRIELDRAGPSYSVDTLEALRAELGGSVELRLLIGADMLAIFYQWRSPRRVIELAEPIVMARPPLDLDELLARLPADLDADERERWRSRIVEAPLIDVSSTRLRDLLAAGRYDDSEVLAALSPAVIEHIRTRGLYRGGVTTR